MKAGDWVRVPKGTSVRSTLPGWGRKRVTGRACVVRVDRVGRDERGRLVTVPAQVYWVGTGGYWKWCDAEAVRVLTDLELLARVGRKE